MSNERNLEPPHLPPPAIPHQGNVGMMGSSRDKGILVLATQGIDSGDGHRIRELTLALDPEWFPFSREEKRTSASQLMRRLFVSPPALLVIEGTGIGAGIPAIAARLLRGVPFVVCSG